jgi:hypothetical protein
MAMKNHPSVEESDKFAHDISDIRPLSSALRGQWNAAKRTGLKIKPRHPAKKGTINSHIVPIAIDPSLLKKVDRYAKSTGMSRSRLVAEGLKLRIKP